MFQEREHRQELVLHEVMLIHLRVLDVMYLMAVQRPIDTPQRQIKIHLQVQDDIFQMVIMIRQNDHYPHHKHL